MENTRNAKLLIEDDLNHVQIYFTDTEGEDSMIVRGCFEFNLDCCLTAWFWIDFEEANLYGFKHRRQISDVSKFEELLRTDWSYTHQLDTYYSKDYPSLQT